jgi:hypothetical protein
MARHSLIVEVCPMRMLNMLSGLGLVLAIAAGASAGGLYRWTNADSVISFSDDLKRIPEAYRASAVVVKRKSLASYERYTPAQAAESKSYRERLGAHVERMRTLNDEIVAEHLAAAPRPVLGSIGDVRVNHKLSIALPQDVRASDEPVIVEEHRVRDGNTTTHVYIVRQGDRVLSVTRPHTNQSGANWRALEDVLGVE